MSNTVLECRNIIKNYDEGPEKVSVLKGINFTIEAGKQVAIVGASGSGKSTLLNMLGGLDTPSQGEIFVAGEPFSTLSDNQRGLVRNRHLGFVYQFHHLLPEFTALENVALPCQIGGEKKPIAQQKATALLEEVGLAHRLTHKPSELSGGERQRVAIARALVNQPKCVLMDEPTGNLDGDNATAIHKLMRELSDQHATSFIIVTHDMTLAQKMDVTLHLNNGLLAERSITNPPAASITNTAAEAQP